VPSSALIPAVAASLSLAVAPVAMANGWCGTAMNAPTATAGMNHHQHHGMPMDEKAPTKHDQSMTGCHACCLRKKFGDVEGADSDAD